jgi:ribosomal protein S13
MGFHKRHIDRENIISWFRRDGIDGLKQLLSADALIVHGNVDTDKIIKYLGDDDVKSLEEMISEMEKTEIENE